MKPYAVLLIASLIFYGCNKDADLSLPQAVSAQTISEASGSGSGGGNNTQGLIQSVLSGAASRLIGGNTDSIWVTFTKPAPAGGWTLLLSSSDPLAVKVPASYPVPAGTTSVQPHVTAVQVTNGKNVTINVKLGTQTKSTVLKVFPLTATFPAPVLQSPGDGANINYRQLVTFDWNDNNNAYFYQLQISIDKAFTSLIADILLNESIWAQSYFNGTGTRYWRVRFADASGNPGPWSQVRSFVERPQ